jgi:hypothetical protein
VHLDYHYPAAPDAERVVEILRDYHRKNITNKKTISKLLWAEHGIRMRYSLDRWFLLVSIHLH